MCSVDEDEGLDLAAVTLRLRMGDYYRTKDMMRADLLRMVSATACYWVCQVLTLISALGLVCR